MLFPSQPAGLINSNSIGKNLFNTFKINRYNIYRFKSIILITFGLYLEYFKQIFDYLNNTTRFTLT